MSIVFPLKNYYNKIMNKSTAGKIFVWLSVAAWLLFKLSNIDFRLGDGNVYVYMANQVLNGYLPYRDFLLADPPVLIMFLAPLKLLFGPNLLFFQAAPIIIEAGTALLLYFLLKKRGNPFAALAPGMYLFSFSILATSDYFTGVQLVIFLAALGLLFDENKRPGLSGASWALACLVKLYAAPALIGFLIYKFINKENKEALKVIAAGAATALLIMGPFLIISPAEVLKDTIWMHWHRPAGISKLNVFWVFASQETALLILGILGMLVAKSKKIILPVLFSLIFLLGFRDIYYLYLDILLPFLVMAALLLGEKIHNLENKNKNSVLIMILALYILFGWRSFAAYQKEFYPLGKFSDARQIADFVKSLPLDLNLYGSHEITPLLALLSGRRIFNNYIETNTQAFASGALDLDAMSRAAAEHGVYLMAQVTDLPKLNVFDFGYSGYFSEEVFKKYCRLLKKFPHGTAEAGESIAIYRCAL